MQLSAALTPATAGRSNMSPKPVTPTPLVRFILESNQLKHLPRSGWLAIGIKNPESLADHSFRTAVIGYLLASLEGLPKDEIGDVVIASLLHDLHEARISDLTPANKKYVKADGMRALGDMLKDLPQSSGGPHLQSLLLGGTGKDQVKAGSSARSRRIIRIVKDADLLEMIFQAKEYGDQGNRYAYAWIPDAEKRIKSKSGKSLLALAKKTDSFEWLL